MYMAATSSFVAWHFAFWGWENGGFFFFFDTEVKKFTEHNIYPFKVYSSVAFNLFIKLCNCHHYVIPEHSYHFKKKPHIC